MKNLLRLFAFTALLFALASCGKDTEIPGGKAGLENSANFVGLHEISSIASAIEFPVEGLNSNVKTRSGKSILKEIETVTEVPGDDGNVVYYIVNYRDNGFIILSADNRIEPVLAFSDSGKFPLDVDFYPAGLVDWLYGVKEAVHTIRLQNQEQSARAAFAWRSDVMQSVVQSITPTTPEDDDAVCENQYETVGPLLQTSWSQGVGYNDLAPQLGCSTYSNGRAPAGCVAVAIAQVMRFHQFPNTYNWSIMPNDWGSYETSRLMSDIGSAVGMAYGCDGSGASVDSPVSALISYFGYASAGYGDFDRDIVMQQLRFNRPVILSGGRKSGWWIFSVYKGGHAWVCDGFKSSFISSDDCSMAWVFLQLHMNWGWGGEEGYLNAWYAYGDWSVDGRSYNYQKRMVYNIRPS
ncbi:MAG: C10 family peptidase [Prevotellaceae bacterium]|nr:C10 family peptidase [Prevotellaceae bacterium]